ncbi:hypothetical protein [Mucilaginibacter lacusdianchii]|uniref:hypothetical protein n=1 Tax=Mucilaginibacter lacusdianchii TaxID=2684211 RepID=UPI00131E8BDA|nr:hypothetical protein [Mucilaginibacter sp. JXJ CY 39]
MAINLLKPYLRLSETAGVSIIINHDGQLAIGLCTLKAWGNQLDITQKVAGLSELKVLAKHLSAKVPVALNLAGKGILIKQIETFEEIDNTNFSKVLPNASLDDFYVQNFISGGLSFVALIRKVEAGNWITKLKDVGYEVLSLSLGPFVVQQVLPQLNFYGPQLNFDGHQITRNESGDWQSYKYVPGAADEFPVKVETEKLEESLVIAYAAAFQLLLVPNILPIKAEVETLEVKLTTTLSDQKLKVSAFIMLGTLFVLLLVNFMLFSYFNSANNTLAEQVGRSSQAMTDVESLEAQVKAKEAMLDSLGWEDGAHKSVKVDQVAQLLPPDVVWQEVTVNPVVVPSAGSETKAVRFTNKRIRIKGSAQRIVQVNEWLGRLKSLRWVKDVRLQDYTYDNEKDTGLFTVLIDY